MIYPAIAAGDRNLAVTAAKRAVQRDLRAHGIRVESNHVGTYGAAFVRDVTKFKRLHNIHDVHGRFRGDLFGQTSWEAIAPIMTANERGFVATRLEQLDARRHDRQIADARDRLVAVQAKFMRCAGEYVYNQIRPFPLDILDPRYRKRYDCSSTVIAFYYLAGLPDPSGWSYNGSGDTGALWRHGHRVNTPEPGDLGFYGWESFPYPRPGHVVMAIGGGRVCSFGHTPPWTPLINEYRLSDFTGWRTYL